MLREELGSRTVLARRRCQYRVAQISSGDSEAFINSVTSLMILLLLGCIAPTAQTLTLSGCKYKSTNIEYILELVMTL